MVKIKKRKLQWRWIVVSIFVVVVLLTAYVSSIDNLSQNQQFSTKYLTYQDSAYGFGIEYPEAWEIRKSTHVFENGDTIAFRIFGPSQKENTDLTDGAQVAISKPFRISKDLSAWAREYFDRYSEFSKISINDHTYQKVYSCGRGCMTYYYTLVNNQTYGVAVFVEGSDEDKMVYENATLYMLKSLKFNNDKNVMITKEEAISKVRALPEVIDYLKRVPKGLILVNGENSNTYFIQVYELKDGHTATFNWYNVFKSTGAIEKQF